MPFRLIPTEIEEISFVDKGASGDDKTRPAIVFWKSANKDPQMKVDSEKVEAILAAMPEEDRETMIAALGAAKQEDPPAPEPEDKQDPPADPEPEDKQDPEPEPEPEDKQDPPVPEDEETEKRDMKKALAEKDAKIKKLEDEKALAAFVKTASEDMAAVPGLAAEDLGAVLKAASDSLPAEVYKRLRTALIACSRAIEKGDLFVEVGSDAEGSETALEKLDRLARELHEQTPAQTYQQCYRKVLKTHPELYAKSRVEGA